MAGSVSPLRALSWSGAPSSTSVTKSSFPNERRERTRPATAARLRLGGELLGALRVVQAPQLGDARARPRARREGLDPRGAELREAFAARVLLAVAHAVAPPARGPAAPRG